MSDLASIEDRFRLANPIPDPANPPMTASTAAALLLDFRERNVSMQTEETTPKTTPPRRGWNPVLVAVAGFLVVLIVGVGVVLASTRGDDVEPATVTTQPPTTATTQPATTTTTVTETLTSSVDEALGIKDAYFVAYNSGDAEAVLGMFATSATFGGSFGAEDRAEYEELLAWDLAQRTTLTPSNCTADELVDEDAVRLSCDYAHHTDLARAVGAPPVPHRMEMTITSDGIARLESYFGQPAFNTVNDPFFAWIDNNHPEDTDLIGFGGWNSVEEAEQMGLLRNRYAYEWAAYLEANGCTYTDTNC